jgi:hypothetical protein
MLCLSRLTYAVVKVLLNVSKPEIITLALAFASAPALITWLDESSIRSTLSGMSRG